VSAEIFSFFPPQKEIKPQKFPFAQGKIITKVSFCKGKDCGKSFLLHGERFCSVVQYAFCCCNLNECFCM